jgi:hypothetical protein
MNNETLDKKIAEVIRDVEDIFEMGFVVGKTFEDAAQGHGGVKDCDELELVLGQTRVRSQVSKHVVHEPDHLEC